MNNDLISRSALLGKAIRVSEFDEGGWERVLRAVPVEEIEKSEAVDAAPVVHGRWEWADDGYCRCTNCTQKAPVTTQYQDEPMTTMTNYCPNCGAKMDKETDNAQK